jgi:type I restriction enzyme M protein
VEYEPDSDLRDTEQIPLQEQGGIEAFILREVSPYAPGAWIEETKTQIGYAINFNRYFYRPQPLRSLGEFERSFSGLRRKVIAFSRQS